MSRLRIMTAPVALLLATVLVHPAEAYRSKSHHHSYRHHHRHQVAARGSGGCVLTNDGRRICCPASRSRRTLVSQSGHRGRVRFHRYADAGKIIGSRPAGCPHAYCGCGLRKHLGLTDKRLNLASNWARLFRREPAPRVGLAAVRTGHVMYIEGKTGGGQWLIRDYNSGGGLSRIHVRSVRGYVFVNPNARVASR